MEDKGALTGPSTLVGLVVAALVSVPAVALEIASHVLVNRHAVDSWIYLEKGVARNRLDQVLRDSLGYENGREAVLRSRPVQEWIELGGELEDEGSAILPKTGRYYNHFHDPLRPWDSAGLTFLDPNESSARWMQNRDQGGGQAAGGSWSWRDARRMYYQALTEPDSKQRESLLAATFRALGQIMHVVADASVPEHVRNDEHPLGTTPFFWSYDRWVESGRGNERDPALFAERFMSNPIGPDPSILLIPIPVDEPAGVPIARLIDADMYNGSNPSVTFNATSPSAPAVIGLAEIANANFFSEDTVSDAYPFPRPGTHGLIRTELITPRRTPDGRQIVRRYWTRPEGQGLLPANPVRAECAGDLNPRGGSARPYPCVDGVVWDQVAAHMLPRAVGYARAVLDYFFRGSMRVETLSFGANGAFIRIANLTDEEMEGVFEIYARPRATAPGDIREASGLINNGGVTVVGPQATVTLPITLLPGESPSASQILVFRGRLGLESDSVAAQVFDVPYAHISQTGAVSTMSESCSTIDLRPTEKGSSCDWRSSAFEAEGEFRSDTEVPVISRVSAAWENGTRTRPAQLDLDGVPLPGGVWRRVATEPDPVHFRVRSGETFGNRLVLRIQLANGDTLATPLAVVGLATAGSKTSYTKPIFSTETGPWWVATVRNAATVTFVHPPFRALSIEGHGNPTDVLEDRFGIVSLRDYTYVREEIRGASYLQVWIDAANVTTIPPPGGPIVLQPILKRQFDAMPVHPLPILTMEAEVERVYEPVELEFLRTFVTAVPPQKSFTIVGQRPADEP